MAKKNTNDESTVVAEKEMFISSHQIGAGVEVKKVIDNNREMLHMINPINKSIYKMDPSLYGTTANDFLQYMRMHNDGSIKLTQ